MSGIGRFAGYKGWKKKGIGHYVMVLDKGVKIAEAKIEKMANRKFRVLVRLKIGDIDEVWDDTKDSFIEAKIWLNYRRREVSKLMKNVLDKRRWR